jgi:hypothetical protein
VSKDLNRKIALGVGVATFSGVQPEAVESNQHACAGMVCVFAIRVDLAQRRYNEPFVDARACIGDVEVAKGETSS